MSFSPRFVLDVKRHAVSFRGFEDGEHAVCFIDALAGEMGLGVNVFHRTLGVFAVYMFLEVALIHESIAKRASIFDDGSHANLARVVNFGVRWGLWGQWGNRIQVF